MNCLSVVLAVVTAIATEGSYVYKEAMNIDKSKGSIVKLCNAPATNPHTVIIAVAQKNLDKIHDMLMQRSKPGPMFQKWLSFDDIGVLTTDVVAYSAVHKWLTINEVKIGSVTPRLDYITAIATIETWEKLLNTTFHTWKDTRTDQNGATFNLAENYHVPSALNQHIISLMGACQLTPDIFRHSVLKGERPTNVHRQNLRGVKYTTVSQLNSIYGISSNIGSSTLSQSVFETNGVTFEQRDLQGFQEQFGLTQQAAKVTGITAMTTGCTYNACGEGSLDIQYLMGISQQTPTIYWHIDSTNGDPFLGYLVAVASTNNPPTTLSISWGSQEQNWPSTYMDQFNTEAMKLGLMGITVFVSSGDDGVANSSCQCDANSGSANSSWSGPNSWLGSGYFPSYPATSPYVVAVGASMGPETGGPEVACQSQLGGVITSGGGFSSYFPQPTWQLSAVKNYLSSAVGQNAKPGFNSQGRAYPDVSFIGVDYLVDIGGKFYLVYGTSASAPVAAALVNLVNSQRQQAGLSTVGFINPLLYANPNYFNDIISGSNSCCVNGRVAAGVTTCCSSGFHASTGWDPVSGLGSISYSNLYAALTGVPLPKRPPTSLPTLKPSTTPSKAPSKLSTSSCPSRKPLTPSSTPTNPPTRVIPNSFPLSKPSTINPTETYSIMASTPTLRVSPTNFPSMSSPPTRPAVIPSVLPPSSPSTRPTAIHSVSPSFSPSTRPTAVPSILPYFTPSTKPTSTPSMPPTLTPPTRLTAVPSTLSFLTPTKKPITAAFYSSIQTHSNNFNISNCFLYVASLTRLIGSAAVASASPISIPTVSPSGRPIVNKLC